MANAVPKHYFQLESRELHLPHKLSYINNYANLMFRNYTVNLTNLIQVVSLEECSY